MTTPTTYAAITTCSDNQFDEYGKRMFDTFVEHWPIPIVYLPDSEVLARSETLRNFREDAGKFPIFSGRDSHGAYDYRFDAIRFAWKVFAVVDCSANLNADVVFWIDADTFTDKKVPMEFVESLLPDDCYTSYFGRGKMYSESGFVAYRKSDAAAHLLFTESWRELYASGSLFRLQQWHDCLAYDLIRTSLENSGRIKSHNLASAVSMHPIVESPLGEYIDHLKGPRKAAGFSEERTAALASVTS